MNNIKGESVIIASYYNADINRVWEALTNVDQMRQWYFPTLLEFEPEVGFETMFNVEHAGKVFPHVWKVLEVVPGKKISYEWKYNGFPGNSVVRFDLFAERDQTRIILAHSNLETFRGDIYPDLAKQNFVDGWTHFIGTALKEFAEQET